MFAACLAFAEIMDGFDKEYLFDLPKFVWCLFGGVVIRNILTAAFKVNMFDRAIDVFGNASLSLFLAMALLNLKLWELTGLAVLRNRHPCRTNRGDGFVRDFCYLCLYGARL